jgi:hypothetical protein
MLTGIVYVLITAMKADSEKKIYSPVHGTEKQKMVTISWNKLVPPIYG